MPSLCLQSAMGVCRRKANHEASLPQLVVRNVEILPWSVLTCYFFEFMCWGKATIANPNPTPTSTATPYASPSRVKFGRCSVNNPPNTALLRGVAAAKREGTGVNLKAGFQQVRAAYHIRTRWTKFHFFTNKRGTLYRRPAHWPIGSLIVN